MTPPLRELPPPQLEPEVSLRESMTHCLTHTKGTTAEEPKMLCNMLCWKLHEAVPFAASGSQEIVSSLLSLLIVLVRFNDPPPPKVVPGRQVH